MSDDKNALFENENVFFPGQHPQDPVGYELIFDSIGSGIASVLNGHREIITITGGHGRGKSASLSAVADGVTCWIEQNRDGTAITFRYVCDTDEKPKYVYQSLLQDLGVDYYVNNKHIWDVWNQIEDELEKQELEGVYLFLDDVDNLVRREDFLDTIVRYSGETDLGVVLTASNIRWDSNLPAGTESRYIPHYKSVYDWLSWSEEDLRAVLEKHIEQGTKDDVVSSSLLEELVSQYIEDPYRGFKGAVAVLYWAIRAAERERELEVNESHLQSAFDRLDLCRDIEFLRSRSLDAHNHALLLSLAKGKESGELPLRTGEVYDRYRKVASKVGLDALSERRLRDRLTAEYMYGILETNLINQGRKKGRGYEINLILAPEAIRGTVAEVGHINHPARETVDTYPFRNFTRPLV